ncbi:hypothetical protein B0H10DRAFT_1956661 [Mycena sp. CBHHK59/15]|nr:hypothetical protein B0H10DRAFT_1956661 [Mycena sp. CBHHK59/15]
MSPKKATSSAEADAAAMPPPMRKHPTAAARAAEMNLAFRKDATQNSVPTIFGATLKEIPPPEPNTSLFVYLPVLDRDRREAKDGGECVDTTWPIQFPSYGKNRFDDWDYSTSMAACLNGAPYMKDAHYPVLQEWGLTTQQQFIEVHLLWLGYENYTSRVEIPVNGQHGPLERREFATILAWCYERFIEK